MRTLLRPAATLSALIACPTVVLAHPGHDGHDFGWDFSAGALHPITGADHLLAAVAIGFWAAQLGGRARWLVPLTFVAVMAIGVSFVQTGVAVPGIEQGIAASILALGLLVAHAARLPLAASALIAGLFAFFHGVAHGSEMSAGVSGTSYAVGLLLVTALLHVAGIGLGKLSATRSRVSTVAGWSLAAVGFYLAVN